MSKFQFGNDSSSDDEDNLPYPLALPRSDFLSPSFSAPDYLSTLSSRHQTLEDLRSDLRERSQALSKELLDLVNTNYEEFLLMGSDLKGGEERVEDVRVGLLGFRRGVEEVRKSVGERRAEVDGLLNEKKGVRSEIEIGRRCLEVGDRLEQLEGRLMVKSLGRSVGGEDWSESEEEDDDDEEGTVKLQRLVSDYRTIERLGERVGSEHPFIAGQEARMLRVRNTILLDLSTALKQAASLKDGQGKVVKILSIYRSLGAGEDAIKILRDLKGR